jgi:DNA polymerase III delta prime subunit
MSIVNLAHANIYVGYSLENLIKIVKNYLCEANLTSCNTCKSCNLINAGNHPDLFILAPESGKNSIGIDSIRTAQAWAFATPTVSNKKFLLVNNANLLQVAASNAILKLLEEPPEYLKWLLLATDPTQILPTILSRCHIWEQKFQHQQDFEAILPQYEAELKAVLMGQKSAIEVAQQFKELPVLQICDAIYAWLASQVKLNSLNVTEALNLMQFMLQQKSILQKGVPLNNQLLLEKILLDINTLNIQEVTDAAH